MTVNPLIRPLGIAASLLTSIQGLAWSVLALLGILIYSRLWSPTFDGTTVTTSYWLYRIFLTDDTIATDRNVIMRGGTMIIFISIYFALSLIWMIISLCKLWVLYRQKFQFLRYTIITWSLCTGIISILDIITLSLLAADYNAVTEEYRDEEITSELPYNAVAAAGIMMTIAARGFALLVANIIFTGLFIFWGIKYQEKDNEEDNREFINGYQQRPAWLSNENNRASGRPHTNQGFESEPNQRFNSYDRDRYSSTPQPNNFGGLGRHNRPLQNHQPSQQERGPYIPEPDYSPTSLRKNPKSVLKTRHQY